MVLEVLLHIKSLKLCQNLFMAASPNEMESSPKPQRRIIK